MGMNIDSYLKMSKLRLWETGGKEKQQTVWKWNSPLTGGEHKCPSVFLSVKVSQRCMAHSSPHQMLRARQMMSAIAGGRVQSPTQACGLQPHLLSPLPCADFPALLWCRSVHARAESRSCGGRQADLGSWPGLTALGLQFAVGLEASTSSTV